MKKSLRARENHVTDQSRQYAIEVGKPFVEGKVNYPQGTHFNFARNTYIIMMAFKDPTKEEIYAVKKGKTEFSCFMERDILVFLFKFKPLPWSDSAYHYHKNDVSNRSFPEAIADGMGIRLDAVLVDADTGIVKAIRQTRIDTDVSRKIVDAINYQIEHPITDQDYDMQCDILYRKYETTMDMVEASY